MELNASQTKLQFIKAESDRDPQMLMFKELIVQGWPKEFKQCPLPIHSFWNFRDKLSIVDGVVVKGIWIVTPIRFRPELLSLLHDDSHLCIDKYIQWAKGSVYWQTFQKTLSQWSISVRNVWQTVVVIRKNPTFPLIYQSLDGKQ